MSVRGTTRPVIAFRARDAFPVKVKIPLRQERLCQFHCHPSVCIEERMDRQEVNEYPGGEPDDFMPAARFEFHDTQQEKLNQRCYMTSVDEDAMPLQIDSAVLAVIFRKISADRSMRIQKRCNRELSQWFGRQLSRPSRLKYISQVRDLTGNILGGLKIFTRQ